MIHQQQTQPQMLPQDQMMNVNTMNLNWKASITTEERTDNANKYFDLFQTTYPSYPRDQLFQKARAVEDEVFNQSSLSSKEDYISAVAKRLYQLKQRLLQAQQAQQQQQQVQQVQQPQPQQQQQQVQQQPQQIQNQNMNGNGAYQQPQQPQQQQQPNGTYTAQQQPQQPQTYVQSPQPQQYQMQQHNSNNTPQPMQPQPQPQPQQNYGQQPMYTPQMTQQQMMQQNLLKKQAALPQQPQQPTPPIAYNKPQAQQPQQPPQGGYKPSPPMGVNTAPNQSPNTAISPPNANTMMMAKQNMMGKIPTHLQQPMNTPSPPQLVNMNMKQSPQQPQLPQQQPQIQQPVTQQPPLPNNHMQAKKLPAKPPATPPSSISKQPPPIPQQPPPQQPPTLSQQQHHQQQQQLQQVIITSTTNHSQPELQQIFWEKVNTLKKNIPEFESIFSRIVENSQGNSQKIEAFRKKYFECINLLKVTPDTAKGPLSLDELVASEKYLMNIYINAVTEEEQITKILATIDEKSNDSLILFEKDLINSYERIKRYYPDTMLNKTGGVSSKLPTTLWFKNPSLNNPFIGAPNCQYSPILPKKKQEIILDTYMPEFKKVKKGTYEQYEKEQNLLFNLKKELIEYTKQDNTLLPAQLIDKDTIVITQILNLDQELKISTTKSSSISSSTTTNNLYIHFNTKQFSPIWKGSENNPPMFITTIPSIQISSDGELYSIQPLCKIYWDRAENIIKTFKQSLFRADRIHRELLEIQKSNQFSIETKLDLDKVCLFIQFSLHLQQLCYPISIILEIPNDYPYSDVNFSWPPEYKLSSFFKDLESKIQLNISQLKNNNSSSNNNKGNNLILPSNVTILAVIKIFEKVLKQVEK
ncbi:hypothetical protein CYY_002039 [Polysphondylium violaceum]|uniref:Mediator complex subunit 15 KIX domain-containing protein n=1 Tax=Polysphondylium violaceum TaxID=133409 RepID=A0A8J4Q0S0_9MYCE|nr:hypothetical protein CYY_002039 [Polysphondylium violaceum]